MVYVVLYTKRSDVIDQSIVLEVIVVEFARPTRELWPVMLTPFTSSGDVDYDALARMVDWYEENGSTGLFAICQSSEVFYLSLQERVRIAAFLKKRAHVPVIASGHVSYALEDQIDELRRVSDTGVDAVILIANRLAESTPRPKCGWTTCTRSRMRSTPPCRWASMSAPIPTSACSRWMSCARSQPTRATAS